MMQALKLIHFEHAIGPLADMGLEHVVTPVFQAVLALPTEGMTPEERRAALSKAVESVLGEGVLEKVFAALVKNADTRATRRLLAVLRTPGEDILTGWENGDGEAEKAALNAVALLDPAEVAQEIGAFFGWLGLSRVSFPGSSVTEETTGETVQTPSLEPSAASAAS